MLNEKTYLKLVMVIVPMLNFLTGTIFDLYAPSLPHIAIDFHAPIALVKNTITVAALGYVIGGILVGFIFDYIGRRKIVISALMIFAIVSLLAVFCHNIYLLILIRLVQGIMGAVIAIGCRTIAADHFNEIQLTIAILYASFSFAFGTVVAPFIGGFIQDHYGFRGNFYAYAVVAIILLIVFSITIEERYKKNSATKIKTLLPVYKNIVTHRKFLSGMMVLGVAQFQILIYPTFASFIVEHQLHYSAIVYGYSALFVSLSYLLGTITNRILLKRFKQKYLVDIGFYILGVALFLQLLFALIVHLNLLYLVLPICLITFATGFFIGNITVCCIKLFPSNIGIITSAIFGVSMLLGGIINFIVNYFNIMSLFEVFIVFFITSVIAVIFYLNSFRRILSAQK